MKLELHQDVSPAKEREQHHCWHQSAAWLRHIFPGLQQHSQECVQLHAAASMDREQEASWTQLSGCGTLPQGSVSAHSIRLIEQQHQKMQGTSQRLSGYCV